MKLARPLVIKALGNLGPGELCRAIVRGGPGSGKTTASLAMFLQLTQGIVRDDSSRSEDDAKNLFHMKAIPPHRILHISASWARARAVQAALDLSSEVSLDARNDDAACTMSSFCASRINRSAKNGAWGKGDQVLHSRSYLETIVKSRLDEVFPPWVLNSKCPNIERSYDQNEDGGAYILSPYRPLASPASHVGTLVALHQQLCWRGGMRKKGEKDLTFERDTGSAKLPIETWEALWAFEDVLQDERVIPSYALANEILRTVGVEDADPSNVSTFVTSTRSDFDAVIVDDAQDLSYAEIKVLLQLFGAAIEGESTNSTKLMCFFEDASQRIFGHRGAAKSGLLAKTLHHTWDFVLAGNQVEDPSEYRGGPLNSSGMHNKAVRAGKIKGENPQASSRVESGSNGRISGLHESSAAPHRLLNGPCLPTPVFRPSRFEWAHLPSEPEEMQMLSKVVEREILWHQNFHGEDIESCQQNKIAVVARTAGQAKAAASNLEEACLPDATIVRVGTAREESLWNASQHVRAALALLQVAVRYGRNNEPEGEDASQRLMEWLHANRNTRYNIPSLTLRNWSENARYTGIPLWTLLRDFEDWHDPGKDVNNEIFRSVLSLRNDVAHIRDLILGPEENTSVTRAKHSKSLISGRKKSPQTTQPGKALQVAVSEIAAMLHENEDPHNPFGRDQQVETERDVIASAIPSKSEQAYLQTLCRLVGRVEENELRRRQGRRERQRLLLSESKIKGNSKLYFTDSDSLKDRYTQTSVNVVLDAIEEAVMHPGSLTSTGKSLAATRFLPGHAPEQIDSWMQTLAEELDVEWELEWQSATEAGSRLLASEDESLFSVDINERKKIALRHTSRKKQVHVMTMHALRDASVEHFGSIIVVGCTDESLPGRVKPRMGKKEGLALPEDIILREDSKALSKTAQNNELRRRRREEHVEQEKLLLYSSLSRARQWPETNSATGSKRIGGRVIMLSSEMKSECVSTAGKPVKSRRPSRFLVKLTSDTPDLGLEDWLKIEQKEQKQCDEHKGTTCDEMRNNIDHTGIASLADNKFGYTEAMPLRLSFSSLSDFMMCPYRYYLKEIENFPPARASPIMTYGTVMHAAVQHYWERRMKASSPAEDLATLPSADELKTYVRRIWFEDASPLFKAEFPDGATHLRGGGTLNLSHFTPLSSHVVLGEKAQEGIQSFVEWVNASAISGGHGCTPPSDVELKLKMDLGTWGKAMKDNDEDGNLNGVTLVGVIDAIWDPECNRTTSGMNDIAAQSCNITPVNVPKAENFASANQFSGIAVSEYKSNAFGSRGRQKIKQIARLSLQPRLYAMLVHELQKKRSGSTPDAYNHCQQHQECDIWGGLSRPKIFVQGIEQQAAVGRAPLDRKDIQETLHSIAGMTRSIRGGNFQPKPGKFACSWCSWKSVCQHALK